MSSFADFFAQVTNAAADAATDTAAAPPTGRPMWTMFVIYGIMIVMVYFAFLRPQSLAKKKQEDTLKAAKTGDRVVTSSGIHGVITNVKDSTVIVRVADNVKLEIEKSHIDKITRESEPEKGDKVAAKVS